MKAKQCRDAELPRAVLSISLAAGVQAQAMQVTAPALHRSLSTCQLKVQFAHLGGKQTSALPLSVVTSFQPALALACTCTSMHYH